MKRVSIPLSETGKNNLEGMKSNNGLSKGAIVKILIEGGAIAKVMNDKEALEEIDRLYGLTSEPVRLQGRFAKSEEKLSLDQNLDISMSEELIAELDRIRNIHNKNNSPRGGVARGKLIDYLCLTRTRLGKALSDSIY